MADANAYNALTGQGERAAMAAALLSLASRGGRFNALTGDTLESQTQRSSNALIDRSAGPVWENNHAAPPTPRQRPADWAVTSGLAETLSPTMGAYGMGHALGTTYQAARAGDYGNALEAGLPLAAMAVMPGSRGTGKSAASRSDLSAAFRDAYPTLSEKHARAAASRLIDNRDFPLNKSIFELAPPELRSLIEAARAQHDDVLNGLKSTYPTLPTDLTIRQTAPDIFGAFSGGNQIGYVNLARHGKDVFVADRETVPHMQRRRVASALQDYVERDLGRRLDPPASLTDEGRLFEQSRVVDPHGRGQ